MANHLHLANPRRVVSNAHHHVNGTDVADLDKYQFWPNAMANPRRVVSNAHHHVNGTDVADLDKYQFWPNAMAMGSLSGNSFQQVREENVRADTQVIGLRTVCKAADSFRHNRDGFKQGRGESYMAFDFKREIIAIRAKFVAEDSALPPALRPLDAELHFDDIASEGIHIKDVPVQGIKNGPFGTHEVTVTISTRRPAKFFAKFELNQEDLDDLDPAERRRLPWRRRATALDFAIAGVVSSDVISS